MKQVFKFDHKTVIYNGNGQYTVTADHGFILREQGTGNLSLTAYTSDYSRYEVIADEGQLNTPSNEENQKAMQTLFTIIEMACCQNKFSEDDERAEAFEAKMREKFPDAEDDNVPPISEVLSILREVGMGEFADAFELAWADKEFTHIIDAMPELPADEELIEQEQEPATEEIQEQEPATEEIQEQEPANEEIQEQEPATEEIQEQEPANETRKEAAEEQPKPTKTKKSKKTSVGK